MYNNLSSVNQSGNTIPGIEPFFFGYGVHISPRGIFGDIESEKTSSSSPVPLLLNGGESIGNGIISWSSL